MRILFSAFMLLAVGCAPKPPNVYVFEHFSQRLISDPVSGHLLLEPSPICMIEIGEAECGHGVAIVSGDEIFVGEKKEHWFKGKAWSQLKRESVYVPAVESYAPLAEYIINACKKMKCSDEVTKFKVKLDGLNGIKGAIEN